LNPGHLKLQQLRNLWQRAEAAAFQGWPKRANQQFQGWAKRANQTL